MPIYEYRCASCGFQKEFLRKMSAAPLTDCPECGKSELKKMVTAAGFQLKGSGWYATDFKNGSQPKAKAEPKVDKPEHAAKAAEASTAETASSKETAAKETPAKEAPAKETKPASAAPTTT